MDAGLAASDLAFTETGVIPLHLKKMDPTTQSTGPRDKGADQTSSGHRHQMPDSRIEPFRASAALTEQWLGPRNVPMSQNVGLRLTAGGRLLGLNSGDWMLLVGGFAVVALIVLLV